MKRRRAAPLVIAGLALATALAPARAQSDEEGAVELPLPLPAGEPAPSPVVSLVPVTEGAARPAWSAQGDRIAYDRLDAEGLSRLYVASAGGSTERCLTCLPLEFRGRHTGAAAWHPSGRYLTFRVERPVRRAGRPLPFATVPGGNRGEDLWAVTDDGKTFWNLTVRGDEKGARFTPARFAPEGDLVAWSERLASAGGLWGQWAIQVAAFSTGRGVPRLKKARQIRPGGETLFVEACDFRPDEKAVLFAGTLSPLDTESGSDLFAVGLEDEVVERLISTPGDWDRCGRYSPDGRWIVWVTNRELTAAPGRGAPQERAAETGTATELWRMDADGRGVERLTRFNDVFSDQYIGRVEVGPPAWSPDGRTLLVAVAPPGDPAAGTLYRLELGPPAAAAGGAR